MQVLPVSKNQVYSAIIRLRQAIEAVETYDELIKLRNWNLIVLRQSYTHNLDKYMLHWGDAYKQLSWKLARRKAKKL